MCTRSVYDIGRIGEVEVARMPEEVCGVGPTLLRWSALLKQRRRGPLDSLDDAQVIGSVVDAYVIGIRALK